MSQAGHEAPFDQLLAAPEPGELGSGDATAQLVSSWLDRQPVAVRDLVVGMRPTVAAAVVVLVGTWQVGGLEALAAWEPWAAAGVTVASGLGHWAWMAGSKSTLRYGRGRPVAST